jgi:diadenosine tetraphosphate (Ap4A) HIT family hydrolase
MPWLSRDEALSALARASAQLPARFAGCAMCALSAEGAEGVEVLAANAAAVVVLDAFWARRGHMLVVLRRHVESIAALPWEEYAAVQRLAWEAARAAERALGARRIYVAALGSVTPLPTTFPHHHVHVIPLHDGGEADRPARVLTWSEGVGVYAEGEAEEMAAMLRRAW